MHFAGKPQGPDSFSFSAAVLCGGPVFAAADCAVAGVVVVVFCCIVVEGVVAAADSLTGSVDVDVGAAVVDDDVVPAVATAAVLIPAVSPLAALCSPAAGPVRV